MIDNASEGLRDCGGIKLGTNDGEYGVATKDGLSGITISNCIFHSKRAIFIPGYITDSCISNIINTNPNCPAVKLMRRNGMKNIKFSNVVSAGGEVVEEICYE